MAHAHRKFHEALDNDEQRANYALEEIQKLYIIERICKENQLNFAELKEVRQKNQFRSCGIWAYGCSSNMFRYFRKVRPAKPSPIACSAGKDYRYMQTMEG